MKYVCLRLSHQGIAVAGFPFVPMDSQKQKDPLGNLSIGAPDPRSEMMSLVFLRLFCSPRRLTLTGIRLGIFSIVRVRFLVSVR